MYPSPVYLAPGLVLCNTQMDHPDTDLSPHLRDGGNLCVLDMPTLFFLSSSLKQHSQLCVYIHFALGTVSHVEMIRSKQENAQVIGIL